MQGRADRELRGLWSSRILKTTGECKSTVEKEQRDVERRGR